MVYRYLYSNPKPTDPVDFLSHVRRCIIPEVRNEIIRYYGAVNCIESKYPGLDYASRGHRLRLSQFKYHRRLFQAFDALRLTRSEIHSLCHWEGTKWAKDKYERDHNVVIRDTTWDGIPDYESRKPPTVVRGIYMEGKGGLLLQDRGGYGSDYLMNGMEIGDGQADEESEQEGSDDFLSRRIRAATNRHLTTSRYRGGQASFDPAWEQWIKDATERGSIPSVADLGSHRRLAGLQAHIPAHYPFATPAYHFGPYSPAPANFTPTTTTYYQPLVPQPLQHTNQYSPSSYSARSTRSHRSRSMR